MLDILDIEGLRVQAQAKAQGWRAEFEVQFRRPLIVAAMVRDILAMPPEVRQQAERDPTLGPALRRLKAQSAGLRPGLGAVWQGDEDAG